MDTLEEPTGYNACMKEGIDLNTLLNAGTTFEIEGAREDYDTELFDHYDDDEEPLPPEAVDENPADASFKEMRSKMIKIDEFLYKRVLEDGDDELMERADVQIHYNAYFEGSKIPFDSSYIQGRPFAFNITTDSVIPGLGKAVRTMKRREKSEFIVDYRIMFGEYGCPPRIPARAHVLYVIKLIDFKERRQVVTLDGDEVTEFFVKFDRAIVCDSLAKEAFNRKNYHLAISNYNRAVSEIEFSRLKDENEENAHQTFLQKLYLNLAICYNKVEKPKKACIALNKLNEIQSIQSNSKALYHKGLALFALGEYDQAQKILERALKLNPSNDDIFNTLHKLDVKLAKYREEERNMCINALGVISISSKDTEEKDMEDFKKVRDLFDIFIKSDDTYLTLPEMLTNVEMEFIGKIGKQLGVELETVPFENGLQYRLRKKVKNFFA